MTLTIPARPTVYEGIQMRSRMEARVAAFLTRCGWRWEYEPRAYADANGQYLPDFAVKSGRYGTLYIDAKGADPDEVELERLRRRMMTIRASEPDAWLGVMTERQLWSGHIAVAPPKVDGFRVGVFVRCPDHPASVGIRLIERYSIDPWCGTCDPDRIRVSMDDVRQYLLRGNDV